MRGLAVLVVLAMAVGCSSGGVGDSRVDGGGDAAIDAGCNPGCYCPSPGKILCTGGRGGGGAGSGGVGAAGSGGAGKGGSGGTASAAGGDGGGSTGGAAGGGGAPNNTGGAAGGAAGAGGVAGGTGGAAGTTGTGGKAGSSGVGGAAGAAGAAGGNGGAAGSGPSCGATTTASSSCGTLPLDGPCVLPTYVDGPVPASAFSTTTQPIAGNYKLTSVTIYGSVGGSGDCDPKWAERETVAVGGGTMYIAMPFGKSSVVESGPVVFGTAQSQAMYSYGPTTCGASDSKSGRWGATTTTLTLEGGTAGCTVGGTSYTGTEVDVYTRG